MNADLDVIIVHYHAAAPVRDAVAALRGDAESSGLTLQIIIADNGSTAEERILLRSLEARFCEVGWNAGYAGAANAAFPNTSADCVVLMNEDVLVRPGCLASLRDRLLAGAAVAGPRFFWDRQGIFQLPCTEERTRRSEAIRVSARRSSAKLERARRAWRGHARRHWRATSPMTTTSLSGALLAFRRDAWSKAGPLDQRYQLYFEEDDWLWRMCRAGLTSQYVPQATAIHLHNPGLGRSPARLRWEAESFQRFGNQYYGEPFMRRLRTLAARPATLPSWSSPLLQSDDGTFHLHLPAYGKSALWIELTPSPLGFPAASTRVEGRALASWKLRPLDGLEFLKGPMYLHVVDDEGQELSGHSLAGL